MLIVADENIAGVHEAFGPYGELRTLPGRSLTATDVREADILLVRSVTRVDQALLEGSRARFVGSATIGTDHMDLAYLQRRGIAYASAPGSNATAVVEYVLSCLSNLEGVLERLIGGALVGIIGLGNVGSRLAARLQRLGIRCIGYDPLLDKDMNLPLCELDQVLQAEVICCHTPLTTSGAFPTFHQLDRRRLSLLPRGAVLINAGRGPTIDNSALLDLLAQREDLHVVLDVWEREPEVDRDLLQRLALATPHIAGYSVDGKLAGTGQLVDACCRFFSWSLPPAEWMSSQPAPQITLDAGLAGTALLRAAIQAVYDVGADDRRLREQLSAIPAEQIGGVFDALRKNYPPRREFAAIRIANWHSLHAANRGPLMSLGFKPAQSRVE